MNLAKGQYWDKALNFWTGCPFFLKYMNKKDGRILDGQTHNDLIWRKI